MCAQQGGGGAVPAAPLLSTVLSSLLSHPAALRPPRRLNISSSTSPLQPSLPALTRLLRLHPPTLRSLSLDAVMSSADLLGLLQPQLFPHLHDLALTFAQVLRSHPLTAWQCQSRSSLLPSSTESPC